MSAQPNAGRRRRNRNRRGGNSGRFADINPQLMTLPYVLETAANTYTEGKVSTPVAVVSNGKMLAMEILRIWVHLSTPDTIAGAGTSTLVTFHIARRTKTAIAYWYDADVIGHAERMVENTAAEGYGHPDRQTIVYDFTDGAGNGLLYAAKELFVGIKGTSNTNQKAVQGKILYRLKEVDVQEYVGLLAET